MVLDVLNPVRPYRPAWPKEKIKKHIHSLIGKHFGPEEAEKFLELEMEW